MTWFKVDDRLHSHPKALATSLAALGLWTLAGSWSGDHLTDGFVSDQAVSLLSRGANKLADELVAAGLWRRVRGGYRFHDWADQNPTKEAVKAERKANAERQKRWREAQRNGSSNAVTNAVTNTAPTRPDPKGREGPTTYSQGDVRNARDTEPPSNCPEHLDDPNPPKCGPCADARRQHGRWEAARNARVAAAPKCRTHRGQPAHNCALCRADALAKEPA